ncbi:MAG TPA: hypothetical protein PK726_04800 [Candidatus Cloacimonadota bacterium]|nr:hypothetical protein [Candidatus Cloacimonadota bacterium]
MKDAINRLTDGLDETQRQALGDLSALAFLLESDVMPDPGQEDVARLLEALEPCLPVPTAPRRPRPPLGWLRLVRSQFVLFESSFWLSGALVLLLGLFITTIDGHELLPLAFVMLSPLLVAAGVAYAFRPETRTLGELERLTATSTAKLLYARLALVLAFNLLIALLLLLLIWLEGPQVLLWRLVLAWLGPMLALTGLALFTSVRWGSLVSSLLPLGLWGSMVLLGWREALLHHIAAGITATSWLLMEISRSTPVLIGSMLACLAGIGLLILSGRAASNERQSWN